MAVIEQLPVSVSIQWKQEGKGFLGKSNIFLGRSNLYKMHLCLISPEKPRRGIRQMFYTSKIFNFFYLSGAKRVNRKRRISYSSILNKLFVFVLKFILITICENLNSKLHRKTNFLGQILNIYSSSPKKLYTSASCNAGDKFHVWRSLRLRMSRLPKILKNQRSQMRSANK